MLEIRKGDESRNFEGMAIQYDEFFELQNAKERIRLAKIALIDTGYFKEDEVGDDIAPRILELHTALVNPNEWNGGLKHLQEQRKKYTVPINLAFKDTFDDIYELLERLRKHLEIEK